MAARLVGEAFLNSFIGVLVDRLVSTVLVNLFQRKKLNRKSVEKLEATLKEARRLLNDAERKQIKDDKVKEWLSDLENAVYMADDLLDGVSTIAEIQKLPGNSESHNYLNSREREITDKMEDIIERLESIVKQKDVLGLEAIPEENMSWRVTTSLVKQSEIYGRDKDKEEVVKLLLGATHDGEFSMISIWGMGGIGKTTLAQLVYNDERVKGKFNFTAWICVGENFDVFNVTKTIIEAITSSSCNMTDLNLLQNKLKEELAGKTFLIVLDDVWIEPLDEKWNILLKPFHYGNKESKILLTTRNENVSLVMSTVQTYELRSLSDEDCLLVFLKHSFLSIECGEYAALKSIGEKIVKKCKGLPLAAKTLGSLLRSKYDIRDWNDVLKSEIWEFPDDKCKIVPALIISYHYLPSHLKRCFVYCSLFPQDHYFDKDELILLWMAEDFLQPMGKKTLEEIGCAYFNELLARSFFQLANRTIPGDRYFVMHDLMHDLATFCAGKSYFRAEELGSTTEIGCKARHLSCNVRDNYPISKLLTACQRAEHIRTFVAMNWANLDVELTSQLKFLRVLSFKSYPPLGSLPHSIGDLIHLRYLDLSHSDIVTLPESLSKLYNLQTLKLNGCYGLKMLPSGMQDLVNLRHLDIRETCLEEMPKAMGKLKHLQFLSNYIVGKDEENKIRELGPLATLQRSLVISNLENLVNSDEASEARIIDKEYINSLVLRWSSNSSSADSPQMENGILDKLRPHSNLKELSIDGYRGTILSDWLGDSSYKNMTKLTLRGCKNCCMLPSLGQLSSLKHLQISCFDRLQSIGAEFYKSGDESCWETPFQSLETLIFNRLDCWQGWRSFEFGGAFPQLKELTINGCPVLIGDLPNHLPALEKLTIDEECKQLACSLPMAPAMLELTILPDWLGHSSYRNMTNLALRGCGNCWKLPSLGQLPSLKYIEISDFYNLQSIGAEFYKSDDESCWATPFQSLETLIFDRLDCWQEWRSLGFDDAFPQLKQLTIVQCPKLIGDLPNHLRALEILTIGEGCTKLACSLPRTPAMVQLTIKPFNKLRMEELPLSLPALSIKGNELVESALEAMTHTQPTCLRQLHISHCDSAFSFPGDCLPSSLQELEISDCKKLDFPMQQQQQHDSLRKLTIYQSCDSLTSFPVNAFPNLTDLNIQGCDSALSFPGDCLPSSLQDLRIFDCKKLDFPMQQQQQHDSLRKLMISQSCDSLTSFPVNAFPNLTDLYIKGCDSALLFPGDCLPSSLQELRIYDCKKLDFPMQQHDSLRKLTIYQSCDSLTSFPLNAFPNLTDLEIWGCENIKSLVVVSQSHDTAISSLRSLKIDMCPKFVSFSTLWMAAPQLESLHIWGCPEIDSFPGGGLPPNLRDLRIRGCDKLLSCLASMDLRGHGLTRLEIGIESENVKSFPKEGWLPTSLEFLCLSLSPSLETLDCNGLSHLTSLQSLDIWFCDKLENMTGERLPASLTWLTLRRCPLLRERWRVKDPQIWSKISHIPRIDVDGRQIS